MNIRINIIIDRTDSKYGLDLYANQVQNLQDAMALHQALRNASAIVKSAIMEQLERYPTTNVIGTDIPVCLPLPKYQS